MTKSFFFSFIFLILIQSISKSQDFDIKAREIKTDEDLISSVFYTSFYHTVNDSFCLNGSSYFFYSTKSNKLYLLTTFHFNDFEKIYILLPFKDSIGNADRREIKQFMILTKDRIKSLRKYDLNLIDMSYYQDTLSKYFFKCYTETNIPNKEEIENFSFQDDLYSIDYSYSIFDNYNYMPFVHRASFASLPKFDLMMKKEFAINCSNRDGSSGSPIILYKNSKYFLLGTNRAIDFGEEYLYEKTSINDPTSWQKIRESGNLTEIDSLKIDNNKVNVIVKDYVNIAYVVKSEIINTIILKSISPELKPKQ